MNESVYNVTRATPTTRYHGEMLILIWLGYRWSLTVKLLFFFSRFQSKDSPSLPPFTKTTYNPTSLKRLIN